MKREIEQLLLDRAKAVKEKNIGKAVSCYKDELRVFDLVNPLERRGKAAVSERLQQWVGSFELIEEYSFKGLEVFTSGDATICSLFNHVKAVKEDGNVLDMWWRETLGLERVAGKWLIMHAHDSVPFDPENGTVSMGLKPGGI